MTRSDLENLVCQAVGSRASVSVIDDVDEQHVHITVSFPWWFVPLWWIRKNAVYALVRTYMPWQLRWTLERKIRLW